MIEERMTHLFMDGEPTKKSRVVFRRAMDGYYVSADPEMQNDRNDSGEQRHGELYIY